jgi:hypothetical protein
VKPGLYLLVDPFRMVLAAEVDDEVRAIELPLTPKQATQLGVQLIQAGILDAAKDGNTDPAQFDAEFAKKAGITL